MFFGPPTKKDVGPHGNPVLSDFVIGKEKKSKLVNTCKKHVGIIRMFVAGELIPPVFQSVFLVGVSVWDDEFR